ncbi:addiction module protein [Algoriphagus sp. NG3]|nr:addiction module protein [Algoriphagus sp. NG3]WPR73413.1 addiction module protein [Algoriphagus sp. NG3]
MKIRSSIQEWQKVEVDKRISAIRSGKIEIENWEDVKKEIFHKK